VGSRCQPPLPLGNSPLAERRELAMTVRSHKGKKNKNAPFRERTCPPRRGTSALSKRNVFVFVTSAFCFLPSAFCLLLSDL
jgi:hypothetical protein